MVLFACIASFTHFRGWNAGLLWRSEAGATRTEEPIWQPEWDNVASGATQGFDWQTGLWPHLVQLSSRKAIRRMLLPLPFWAGGYKEILSAKLLWTGHRQSQLLTTWTSLHQLAPFIIKQKTLNRQSCASWSVRMGQNNKKQFLPPYSEQIPELGKGKWGNSQLPAQLAQQKLFFLTSLQWVASTCVGDHQCRKRMEK